MYERKYTRVDTIRSFVDNMLLENNDDEDRRCGYVHLYGVGQAAALLALKRGHNREYAELAQIAGMLHDFISYQGKDGPNHAHEGGPVVREILKVTGEFSTGEINMICQAIYNHSDKHTIGAEFDEILKDADVMQHWLRNPMEDFWFNKDRTSRLLREFGIENQIITGMTFQEAIDLYREVYQRFEKVEFKQWGIHGTMIELSKQVGDLSKWVMVKEQYYAMNGVIPDNIDEHIGDELADIFGQLIRIADYYNIDLEKAHIRARKGEDECLKGMGV